MPTTSPQVVGRTNGRSSARDGFRADGPVPARRLSSARWRQPRLLVGLLLVTLAAVLGARAFAALDDSVLVWRVESAARAGSPAGELQVRAVGVRFHDQDTEAAYLPADVPLETSGVLGRDLGAGELLLAADVLPADERSAGELPLDVPAGSVPVDLAVGDRIDVWVVPGSGSDGAPAPAQAVPADADRVLGEVRVAAVTAPGTTVGDTRQLVVDLSDKDVRRLDAILGPLATGSPVAVRVPAAS